MKQYRLWGQAMVPQLAFDRFLVSLERLASKREFRDRVDAMQHDGTPFSSTINPAPVPAESADNNNSGSGGVVILQGLPSHNNHHDDNEEQEEPFDRSAVDPDDLIEAQPPQRQQQQQQTMDDDELDELERMAAEADEQ